MRNPRMDGDASQSNPATGVPPTSQDRSSSKRAPSSSCRDPTSSDQEDKKRSQTSSTIRSDNIAETSRYKQTRGNIKDAVNQVLEPLDPNHTTIPAEVLNQITSQITANVLQQLKASQFSPPSAYPTSMTDHTDANSSRGGSPLLDRDKVYTPPSPYRASEEAAQISPVSPRKQSKSSQSLDPRRPPSPPFSHGTLSDSDAKETAGVRSRTERLSSDGDATIFDKIWGTLFDEQGRPTLRMSQFLRGIAVHLIEDYEPKHSLVITPDKMQKYYAETKSANEIYPWQVIFDDRTSSISRMFREVEAQHHLVQDRLNERPDTPGLTPAGFETWMTMILKAHPDQEFDRLAYTALHMPVSNPDDKRERFPKELSRRQFPKEANNTTVAALQKIMHTHCGVRVNIRSGSVSDKDGKPLSATTKPQDVLQPTVSMPTTKPVPQDYPLGQTSTRSTVPEIDRNVLRPTVSEAAVEDSPPSSLHTVPQPIERERKPYVAQPGGGKLYDNVNAPPIQQPSVVQIPADSRHQSTHNPAPKLTRSTSLNNGRSNDSKYRSIPPIAVHQKPSQAPPAVDIPSSARQRNGSYHRDPPNRGDRNRSPSSSRNNEYAPRVEGDVSYGSYQSSSSAEYMPSSYRSDTRHDPRGSFSAEARDRDREPRQRYNSMSAGDSHRYYTSKDYPSDDDYYRSSNAGHGGQDAPYSASQQYPPTSYRR